MIPRVKVCCIQSEAEAALAIEYGAAAVGLVSKMPSGPGPIDDSLIRSIARTIPPGVSSFLLTCETTAAAIIRQQRDSGANTLQLVDHVGRSTHKTIRESLPGVAIVQVIHVQGEQSVTAAVDAAHEVNALLLDSGNPGAAIKELGGTGRAHDWALSRRIRDSVNVPLYLAGGLNPENVGRAIAQVAPFGVDVCSGLRTNGLLDERKLAAFMTAVHRSAD